MDHDDPTLDVDAALREEEELAALAELGAAWTAEDEPPSGTPPRLPPREGDGPWGHASPRGGLSEVTRGWVPEVLDCCTTDSFWRPFWYPFLGPTCTQFYKKLQNEAPKRCQKGARLLAQQSRNKRAQQSRWTPIKIMVWPPRACAIVAVKESLSLLVISYNEQSRKRAVAKAYLK